MVPIPVASAMTAPLLAPERTMLKTSSASTLVSPLTVMEIVFCVSPALKWIAPLPAI